MASGSGGNWFYHYSLAGLNKGLVKVGTAAISGAIIENYSAAKQYFQLFAKDAEPATNDVPVISVPLYSPAGFTLDQTLWGPCGQRFEQGLAWGCSTTVNVYTPGTTDCLVQIWYR
jgi:hypothetical protein